MQLIQKKATCNRSGFTLVELAIVILIVGMIITTFSVMNKIYVESHRHYKIQGNLDNVKTALNFFRNNVGRFPCPANPALNPGDVGYGAEDCSLTAITGERDADGIAGNDPVLTGNLPLYGFDDGAGNPAAPRIELKRLVTTTKLEGRDITDPWNGEFTYAVSQLLTNSGSFNTSFGVIRITDEWGRDTGGTTANAQYAILSQGEENRSGCTVDLASSRVSQAEQENCDGDGHFAIALYHKSNTDHYDDYLTYARSGIEGIWGVTAGSALPDVYNRDTNGKVFIGPMASYDTTKPNNLKLDVAGNIFAEERIASNLICDSDGTTCFTPESLFSLSCPNIGQYMRGVQINGTNNLEPICEHIDFIPTNDTCPAGSFVNGIYTNGGNLVCEN